MKKLLPYKDIKWDISYMNIKSESNKEISTSW